METQGLSLDRINTLPKHIIEDILSLMPIQDALKTSILSKKFRYCWRNMPKLTFTDNEFQWASISECGWLNKQILVNAVFHVLFLHNGPTILEFNWSLAHFDISSELDQIISRLAMQNTTVKELIIVINNGEYRLPVAFCSVQGLEHIHLENCSFKPDGLTFDGFSRLRKVHFYEVEIFPEMLHAFLSKCPLLEDVCLNGQVGIDFAPGRSKFTFVDLFKCIPFVETLDISKDYMKYLCAENMPRKLPTSLDDLKYLFLDVCLMEHREISSVLCMMRSSPLLAEINIVMYDNERSPLRQTPTNFFDPEDYKDLKLDNLTILDIKGFSNLPLEMEFVKLIMAKSPILEKIELKLNEDVSKDEELEIRGLVRGPIPRASPLAELIIHERQGTCL